MVAGRATATNRRGTGTCPRCGKVCYTTRADAKHAKRTIHPGEKMHAYQCGPVWHYGHDELWRELLPEDLIWEPMPTPALAQVLAMARITFDVTRGAA
jgi:hypothetical protein